MKGLQEINKANQQGFQEAQQSVKERDKIRDKAAINFSDARDPNN